MASHVGVSNHFYIKKILFKIYIMFYTILTNSKVGTLEQYKTITWIK